MMVALCLLVSRRGFNDGFHVVSSCMWCVSMPMIYMFLHCQDFLSTLGVMMLDGRCTNLAWLVFLFDWGWHLGLQPSCVLGDILGRWIPPVLKEKPWWNKSFRMEREGSSLREAEPWFDTWNESFGCLGMGGAAVQSDLGLWMVLTSRRGWYEC